jgi:hypothetical protein
MAQGGRIGLQKGKDVMPVRMSLSELHDFLGLEKSKGKTPFNKIYRNLDADAYLDLNPGKVTQKAGGGSQWMFDKPSKVQIEEIMKIHTGSGGAQSGTIRKYTADAVRKLYKDKTFINFLEKYKKGDKIPTQVIRKIFSADGAYSPHIASTLGRILEGQLELEGIKVNKKLGAKIQQGMEYSTKGQGIRGAWHTAAYTYARNQLNSLDPSKSFRSYQNDVTRLLKELNLPNMSVDEIRSIRSGGTTSPWSVFSQIMTEKQNKFKGYKFDSETSKKQTKLNNAIKKHGIKSSQVADIIQEQDKFVESFRNQHPEFKKTNLTRFDLRPPEQVLGTKVYNKLPLGIKNALDADFAKNEYSINAGKGVLTQRQLIDKLQQKGTKLKPVKLGSFPANIDADMFDFRKLPEDMRHFTDVTKKFVAQSPTLSKAFKTARGAGRWTGAALAWEPAFAAPFAGYGYLSGESPERILGDATIGLFGETEKEELKKATGELGYATQQIDDYGSTLEALKEKWSSLNDQNDPRGEQRKMIENLYNNTQGKYSKAYNMFVDDQGEFNKGKYNQALNNYTAGLVQIDKFKKQLAGEREQKRIETAEKYILPEGYDPEDPLTDDVIRDIKGFAGGGLANLTRTVAPDSGPMSQGLRSLYINDRDY